MADHNQNNDKEKKDKQDKSQKKNAIDSKPTSSPKNIEGNQRAQEPRPSSTSKGVSNQDKKDDKTKKGSSVKNKEEKKDDKAKKFNSSKSDGTQVKKDDNVKKGASSSTPGGSLKEHDKGDDTAIKGSADFSDSPKDVGNQDKKDDNVEKVPSSSSISGSTKDPDKMDDTTNIRTSDLPGFSKVNDRQDKKDDNVGNVKNDDETNKGSSSFSPSDSIKNQDKDTKTAKIETPSSDIPVPTEEIGIQVESPISAGIPASSRDSEPLVTTRRDSLESPRVSAILLKKKEEVEKEAKKSAGSGPLPKVPLLSETPSKSILVTRNKAEKEKPPSPSHSIEVNYSTDTGIYRFFKRHGKDESQAHVTKTEAFIYMTIPPDGGYAWFILAMAFLCQVIVDGILFSIGILLPYIATDLSMSYKQTALVASTQIGIYFFSAPLGSAFINRYGFRPVAIAGSLLSSLAIFIASFSQGTTMLVFFYGVIAGPSMGMIWVSTSLIVNYYFERYRAIVGGIASAGSGVGVILISLLNFGLINDIGWRNTARVHVMLLLLTGILTSSYREVPPTQIGHYVEYISDDETEESANSVEIGSEHYSFYAMPDLMRSVTSMASASRNIERRLSRLCDSGIPPTKPSRMQRLCPCCARKETVCASSSRRYVISHGPLDRDDIFYDGNPDYSRAAGSKEQGTSEGKDIEIMTAKEDKAKTINYTLSVMRPPTAKEETRSTWIPSKISSAFNALFDFNLFKLAEFRLLLVESLLFPMGFNIPFVYSTSRAEIREDFAKFLPVLIGFTNIILRISIGFVAYKIKFHVAYLSGGGMTLGGLITLLSGFMGQKSIPFQFAYAICFGVGAASFGALRALVYVKVLGLERLTNAFGLTSMVMGIGVFIGTNMAGILTDSFSGYKAAFIFSGSCMTAAGIFKLFIPKYAEYRRVIDAKKAQKKVRFAQIRQRKKWYYCGCCGNN